MELYPRPAFALPGLPHFREHLYRFFHPPVIQFADGGAWIDESNWNGEAGSLTNELIGFVGLLGAGTALSVEFRAKFPVQCRRSRCPWYRTGLCWKVSWFPGKPENCVMPGLYREQMNINLPRDTAWNVGKIDRPITKAIAEQLKWEDR